MYRFDRTLIDPTPEMLDVTLAAAAEAANRGFRARLLSWPFDGFADFVRSWRPAPGEAAGVERPRLAAVATRRPRRTRLKWGTTESAEPGQRQWAGQGAANKRGAGGDTRSVAALAWWYDPLGRRHCRVVSDRVLCGFPQENDLFLSTPHDCHGGGDRPILWRVYPDDLYLRQEGGDWRLWAACRCGATGTPEELGWMGPWCAACHDRVEEGARLSRPGDCPPVVFTWPSTHFLHDHADASFGLGGRVLLTRARYGFEVHRWEVASGQHRTVEFGGTEGTRSLAVSPDGSTAAVCIDATVFVWSLLDDGFELTIPVSLDGVLAFSPDGQSLAVAEGGDSRNGLSLYDLPSTQPRWSVTLDGATYFRDSHCLAFSPDGRTIAFGGRRQGVGLFHAADGSERTIPLEGDGHGCVLAFSPDGKTLVTGVDFDDPDHFRVYDAITGRLKVSLPGPAAGLAFSLDGKTLAVVGRDGRLRLLDAATWRTLAVFRWHQNMLTAVAFSPDGRWLATCGHENRVKLWPYALLANAVDRSG